MPLLLPGIARLFHTWPHPCLQREAAARQQKEEAAAALTAQVAHLEQQLSATVADRTAADRKQAAAKVRRGASETVWGLFVIQPICFRLLEQDSSRDCSFCPRLQAAAEKRLAALETELAAAAAGAQASAQARAELARQLQGTQQRVAELEAAAARAGARTAAAAAEPSAAAAEKTSESGSPGKMTVRAVGLGQPAKTSTARRGSAPLLMSVGKWGMVAAAASAAALLGAVAGTSTAPCSRRGASSAAAARPSSPTAGASGAAEAFPNTA